MAENKLAILGEEIEKEVTIDGQTVIKNLVCTEIIDFNDQGKITHIKNGNGFEKWKKYNKMGKLISTIDTKGNEYYYEYDNQGNKISEKDKKGNEVLYQNEYDSNGNLIYWKNCNTGYEKYYEYDENNNMIFWKYGTGLADCRKIYNKNGKLIQEFLKDANNLSWWKYDENGNLLREITNYCIETRWSYNEKSLCMHIENEDGDVWSFEYNEHDDVIYKKCVNANCLRAELFYEYEYWPNGKQKQVIQYESPDNEFSEY